MLRIVMLVMVVCGLSAEDWPHFRGPDGNSAVVSDKALAGWSGAKELWSAEVGTGFSSVVISEGKLIAVGNEGDRDIVRCLDAATGKELWQQSFTAKLEPRAYDGGPNVTPTIADGFVYGMTKQGTAWCLGMDGKQVWQRELAQEEGFKAPGWGFAGAPLVYGKVLILNAGPAGVCLDRKTGKTVWSSGKGGGAGYAAPVKAGEGKRDPVLIFAAKHLIAIDPAKGRTLWKAPWETSYDVNAAAPIACAGGWFVSTGYGRGCGLITAKGSKAASAWENRNMMTQMAGCVLVGDHIYGVSAHGGRPGELRCLDPGKEGALQWKQGGFGQGTLIAVDETLLVLTGNGELVMARADAGSYQELGRARILNGTCWAPPSYVDGQLYARNSKGHLVCVQLR